MKGQNDVTGQGGLPRRATGRSSGRFGQPGGIGLFGTAAIGLGLAASAGVVRAAPAEPTKEELLRQLKTLQEQVERLEAKQEATDRKADEARTREVDATVEAIRQDAARRSQLMDVEGFTAGYTNGKFLIQSADGKFVLNPNLQFQFRGVADFRQDSKNGGAGSDDVQDGFEVRRLKISFDGNVFSKDLTYKFQWATSRSNGTLVLDEGWVRYQFHDTPYAIRAGSMLNDFDHETAISSKRQLAAERSVLHEVITSGAINSENYVQGVQGIYDDGGELRGSLLLHDGFNSRNTNFQDTGGGSVALGINNPQWAVAGRVDYKLDGDWKQYDDFTALNYQKYKGDLLVVGGGFDVDSADNVTAFFHTVDAQWEPQEFLGLKGLGFYAAYVGLYRDFRNVAAGVRDTPYDWGFLAQASYLIDPHWEVFARYDYTDLDAKAPTGAGTLGAAARVEDKLHEITVGANYYFYNHAAKVTVDGTWLPNGSPLDLNGAGILPQPNDKDQFVLRAQFQLLL